MPVKKLNGQERGYLGESTAKKKPPKPYIESEWLTVYRRERNIILMHKYPNDTDMADYVRENYTGEQIEEVRLKYDIKQLKLL